MSVTNSDNRPARGRLNARSEPRANAYGEHTAVVFPRLATGNVAPKRILRNAPAGAPTSGFGNPGAVAFDMKREEILVPN